MVLRALLQHYRLSPVLDLLLDHIGFKEYVLSGASPSLELLYLCRMLAASAAAIRRAWLLHCGGSCVLPAKANNCPALHTAQAILSYCIPEKLL